jgi:hypothetical protein
MHIDDGREGNQGKKKTNWNSWKCMPCRLTGTRWQHLQQHFQQLQQQQQQKLRAIAGPRTCVFAEHHAAAAGLQDGVQPEYDTLKGGQLHDAVFADARQQHGTPATVNGVRAWN